MHRILQNALLLTSLLLPTVFGFTSNTNGVSCPPSALPSSLLLDAHDIKPVKSRRRVAYVGPSGQEWISRSIEYYTKIMRHDSVSEAVSTEEQSRTAKKLYHAIQQVRSGKLERAENIYRRTIQDIRRIDQEEGCRNAELATTTLLLALVLQRMNNIPEARRVFHRFFRTAVEKVKEEPHECLCTAKVLGAYSLFEMRFGSIHRSFEIARQAIQFDSSLSKILDWKQFRDARTKIYGSDHRKRRQKVGCDFVSEINLPNDVEEEGTGSLRVRAYQHVYRNGQLLQYKLNEPCVIYHTSKSPLGKGKAKVQDVPIRIQSSCVGCEIYGEEDSRCKEELDRSMAYIRENGGAIIYYQPSGQGTSIASSVVASVLQAPKKNNQGYHNKSPRKPRHTESDEYRIIPSILENMGIESVRLVTNNPVQVRRLKELGVKVRGTLPFRTSNNKRTRVYAEA